MVVEVDLHVVVGLELDLHVVIVAMELHVEVVDVPYRHIYVQTFLHKMVVLLHVEVGMVGICVVALCYPKEC
jgi:hypothetical protein